jgi:hypothetical protein
LQVLLVLEPHITVDKEVDPGDIGHRVDESKVNLVIVSSASTEKGGRDK